MHVIVYTDTPSTAFPDNKMVRHPCFSEATWLIPRAVQHQFKGNYDVHGSQHVVQVLADSSLMIVCACVWVFGVMREKLYTHIKTRCV